jgi:ribosomal protein S18 acetylase RimI-like enzyme
MNKDDIIIRKATIKDIYQIYMLYVGVSKVKGGIARVEDEITLEYVNNFIDKSIRNGVQFVAVDTLQNKIIAEIHCYKLEPKVFEHILSELTIVVDKDFQGKGIGKTLFQVLLDYVSSVRNDILRIELIARESNIKAIELYKELGFEIEGKLSNRIRNDKKQFEADIPMAWFNNQFKV